MNRAVVVGRRAVEVEGLRDFEREHVRDRLQRAVYVHTLEAARRGVPTLDLFGLLVRETKLLL